MTALHSPLKIPTELSQEMILLEILPRLPAKSAGRFRCVCKHWLSFLSTQQFERKNVYHITNDEYRTHHKVLMHQEDFLIEFQPISSTFLKLDCEAPGYSSIPIRFIPFKTDIGVFILVSLDGLVCVAIGRGPFELILWNPLTCAYKKLPCNSDCGGYNIHFDTLGFYRDSSNDYKILHIATKGSLKAYIYSRRLDLWRKIEYLGNSLRISKHLWSLGTFCGESLYFTVRDRKRDKSLIIGFDVNSEEFREIPFPLVPSGSSFLGCLVNVNECINLFVTYEMGRDTLHPFRLDIWRREGEEWKNVGAYSRDEKYYFTWTPIFVMRNGKWLVMVWECHDKISLYEVDMKTNDYVCLYHESCCDILQHTTYIETLVSPNP